MKNFFHLLFLVLFCTGSIQKLYAQRLSAEYRPDPVGIGLLFINKMKDLPLCSSQNSSLPLNTIKIKRITEGTQKGTVEIRASKLNEAFSPFECSPGSSDKESISLINSGLGPRGDRLVFRVLKCNGNEYEVVISEKDKTTAIIKIPKGDSMGGFETWEHYLERVVAIAPIGPYDGSGAPIFDLPGGNRINPEFQVPRRIDSVNGYWARITDHRKISGWVKWRDDNKLLVQFIEHFIK